MPLLNTFFQNSIFVLLFICLLTIIFAFRNKKSKTRYNQSEATDKEFHQLEEKLRHLQDENTSLEEKLRHLQTDNTSLKKELQRLNSLEQENQRLNKVIAEKNENSRKWAQKKKDEKEAAAAAEREVRNNLSRYYYRDDTLMNKSESFLFFYITQSLDEIFLNRKGRDYYYLFPQASIFSFIKQTKNFPKHVIGVGGKNIDFVLCHCQYSDKATFFKYEPILMIEIDGPHHFEKTYETQDFQQTQESDRLKNNVAYKMNIPLLRYRLNDGEASKADKAGIHTALCKFFSDHNAKQTEYIYYYDQNGALSKNQYYNPPWKPKKKTDQH